MIEGAEVELLGSDGSKFVLSTDKNGMAFFNTIDGQECIKKETEYSIKASIKDFLVAKDNFSTQNLLESRTFIFEFLLSDVTTCGGCCYPPPVYFDVNDDEPIAYKDLDYLIKMLIDNPKVIIQINGYSDLNESNDARLSERRAKSCVSYLNSKGIDIGRLKFKGYSSDRPVITERMIQSMDKEDEKLAARQKNRRIDIVAVAFDWEGN